ncbi:hypothetical protein H5410_021595, partial [Solanum commersonii]
TLEKKAISRPIGDSPTRLSDPQAFISSFFLAALFLLAKQCPFQFVDSSTPNLNFYLSSSKTQVNEFKKDVSNSATQDSIMTVHNKTQFTHARINCVPKDLSCYTLSPKILTLTILCSNASSSSTKEFEFPYTKDDSILTHNGLII